MVHKYLVFNINVLPACTVCVMGDAEASKTTKNANKGRFISNPRPNKQKMSMQGKACTKYTQLKR